MDDWLSAASAAIGGGEVSDADAKALLEIASVAAHESGSRINAPLLCYLVGQSQGNRSLAEILEAVRRSSS